MSKKEKLAYIIGFSFCILVILYNTVIIKIDYEELIEKLTEKEIKIEHSDYEDVDVIIDVNEFNGLSTYELFKKIGYEPYSVRYETYSDDSYDTRYYYAYNYKQGFVNDNKDANVCFRMKDDKVKGVVFEDIGYYEFSGDIYELFYTF